VLANTLAPLPATTIVVLNKVDRVARPELLPLMATLGELLPGREIIPASALTGENVDTVLGRVVEALPEGERLYQADEYTTATERFLVQELVREQLFRQTEEEVPYGTAVLVEEFTERPEGDVLFVRATILVDRPSQKPIVIGAGGQRLREIGRRPARCLDAGRPGAGADAPRRGRGRVRAVRVRRPGGSHPRGPRARAAARPERQARRVRREQGRHARSRAPARGLLRRRHRPPAPCVGRPRPGPRGPARRDRRHAAAARLRGGRDAGHAAGDRRTAERRQVLAAEPAARR